MTTETQSNSIFINKFLTLFTIFILCICIFNGCAAVNFSRVRYEHAKDFSDNLAKKSETIIPSDGILDLDECISIALENNLDIRINQINGRLADIGRDIAFSYFLPHVNLEYTTVESDEQQLRKAGTTYVAAADKSIIQRVVSSQLAVFNPSTWFLYNAYTKRADIQSLLEERVRQAIRLQIIALYIACLSHDASVKTIESSIDQAGNLVREMAALHREGLILRSDLEKARLFLAAQENRLMDKKRIGSESKSELMEAMGLSPLVEISLKDSPCLSIDAKDISSQIFEAMMNRLDVKISDRDIFIRKDEINVAIASFFPKIFLFGNYTYSNNSFNYYENILSYGISGVLTLFDGFANVQDYRIAKEKHEQAMLEREQSCMKIMLEVISARNRLDTIKSQQRLLEMEMQASKVRLREIQALWREGMVTSSEKLSALADYTTSEANVTLVNYQYQVAIATMLDVMGLTGKENESEKTN